MEDRLIKQNKHTIAYIILSFLLVFLLSFAILFYIENQVRNVQFDEIKSSEHRLVKLENESLGREFETILGDLHYLNYAYKGLLANPSNYEDIAGNWTNLSTERRIYDQIRFIDVNGDERIRININDRGGYIVDGADLQNKKDRYYFYEAIKLEEGGVHISKMDLNVEKGQIEEPLKPMIRFSMPVFDENENLLGVIVLNYLVENLLENFKEIALNSEGQIVLLNLDGYWLSSTNTSQEWNFMYEDRMNQTFDKMYSEEWDEVIKGNNQIITEKGLFTFASVMLKNKDFFVNGIRENEKLSLGDGKWYIVSMIPRENEQAVLFTDHKGALIIDVLMKNILYFSLMFVVSGVVAFLVYLNRKNFARIKYYSEYDPLTKVLNRRAGIEKINRLFPEDDKRSVLVSLCFIDINGLKQVNDTFGHERGDELIRSVSSVIKETIREEDFLIRMGGDEFLIVFKDINREGAEKVWSRITAKYDEINRQEERPYVISVSHGIVSHNKNRPSQIDEMIKLADEAMYEEKRIMKQKLTVIRGAMNHG